jgi:hypothetical protein
MKRRAFLQRAAITMSALVAAAGTSFRTGKVQAAESAESSSTATRDDVPKVGILVFEGVQIIDFAGPYDVFGEAGYDVFTVAATKGPLTTVMNLSITPRYSFADAPQPDVLLIPAATLANGC